MGLLVHAHVKQAARGLWVDASLMGRLGAMPSHLLRSGRLPMPAHAGPHILEESNLATSRVSPVPTLFRFGRSVSRSPLMRQVLAALSRLAQTELTITIVGETGTGKDVM